MRIPILWPALLAAALLPAPAAAQAPGVATGPVARMVEWIPHAGAQAAFDAGYQRHLDWHRAHDDPWTWHGWRVASGDRLGTFVDASFGHDWQALDHSVAPAEDGADNARNVHPHADAVLAVNLVRLPAHSLGDEADSMRSPMLAMLRIPGDRAAADALWAGLDAALAGLPRQAYRVVGGEASWLVAIPHRDWAGFGVVEAAVARWQAGNGGIPVRLEVLRRDPAMSYAPAR